MSLCKHCGLDEDSHCTFEPEKTMPEGCQCPEGEWDEDVSSPCDKYDGDGGRCSNCEHDLACHKEA